MLRPYMFHMASDGKLAAGRILATPGLGGRVMTDIITGITTDIITDFMTEPVVSHPSASLAHRLPVMTNPPRRRPS